MKQYLLPGFCLSLSSIALVVACTSQKTVATAETDLCRARAEFKILEDVTPSLQPTAASARAKLEIAEDTFCKALPDGG